MNTQATIIQGSPEWHALRLGRVTASRVGDVIVVTVPNTFIATTEAMWRERIRWKR